MMAAPASSASPCLVAILLVIQPRSGSGARVVFHYPPEPLSAVEDSTKTSGPRSQNDYSSSSSSNDCSSMEEEVHNLRSAHGSNGSERDGRSMALTDDEEEHEHEHSGNAQHYDDHPWKPSWEPLLGLGSLGLAGLLAAGRIWHKRKFELGINDLCFVGWPVFVREDGHWRRQKKSSTGQDDNSVLDQIAGLNTSVTQGEIDTDEFAEDSAGAVNAQSSHSKSRLTMFNIVSVLDPPTLDYDLRVREIYQHVVKKFSRALKREQAHSDFVWKESEIIQSIKSRHMAQHSSAKALYSELLSKSALASAIASVYRAVSSSRIASVNLSPSTSVVLQIPPVSSVSVLPSLTEPPAPAGLWLTTFNDASLSSSEIEGLTATSAAQLAKHVTLLLKETPQRIIKDAQATGGPLAGPLTKFVAAVRPTKSFHKIASASQISWSDIQLLASHLIMWRRAMVIPPLHQRDSFIVSPNADVSKLKSACRSYNTAFPTLPGLATMLGALSDTPRPWMTLIPSSDHKEAYYEILAWLMKGGWITHLRTFAYVRVSPEVKRAVREQERKEKLDAKMSDPKTASSESSSHVPMGTVRSDPLTNNDGIATNQSFTSDTNSQESRRPSLMSRPSSDQRQSNLLTKQVHDPNAASFILNPSRASPLESKWLDHVANSFLTTQYSSLELSMEDRVMLKAYWQRFVKYFNGSEPLEFIPVREGLKRKFVWDLLGKMGLDFEGGIESHGNGKILVTIRHW